MNYFVVFFYVSMNEYLVVFNFNSHNSHLYKSNSAQNHLSNVMIYNSIQNQPCNLHTICCTQKNRDFQYILYRYPFYISVRRKRYCFRLKYVQLGIFKSNILKYVSTLTCSHSISTIKNKIIILNYKLIINLNNYTNKNIFEYIQAFIFSTVVRRGIYTNYLNC